MKSKIYENNLPSCFDISVHADAINPLVSSIYIKFKELPHKATTGEIYFLNPDRYEFSSLEKESNIISYSNNMYLQ